jgi:hypothetical protein
MLHTERSTRRLEPKPAQRSFTSAYKLAILEQDNQCRSRCEVSALLRLWDMINSPISSTRAHSGYDTNGVYEARENHHENCSRGADSTAQGRPARLGAGEKPTAQSRALPNGLDSESTLGTRGRATANGARSRQRSTATRPWWTQRGEPEGWWRKPS